MSEQCTCKSEEPTIFPCVCGSNCDQVAVNPDNLGAGKIYCLTGITRSAKRLVTIDDRQVTCAKNTFEHVGLKTTYWICVTEQGVNKNHGFELEEADVELITQDRR